MDDNFLAVFQEEARELKVAMIIDTHALARPALTEESTDARRQ